ncbi:hypothetical protein F4802DRAFT_81299 [Xylaria palmicola]|nr:hypothetical protein F4802DRAFT_81299 [Xylaria palmicola]
MSMAKDTTAHSRLPQRKRRTSISGFFSKILPRNRAEQGGTARNHDYTGDNDSAYLDLGMNPNDLTEWNLAQEKPGRLPASGAGTAGQHHRVRSWSAQKRSTQVHDGVGQSPKVLQPASSPDPARPPQAQGHKLRHRSQHGNSQPITREEVRNMLRAKEATRRDRKTLKESGDWLGVQGADPYSGEFAVLTPTSTLSSEVTPTSTRERLAELSRQQKAAKLAYEQARREEETEKEKALWQKGQSKLDRMANAKDELRQQRQGFPTWIQHKRRWSSAAEPDLSPIPQSLRSYKVNNSSDEGVTGSPRNFSRPSKANDTLAADQSKLGMIINECEDVGPSKRNHHRDPSTDTIVHKTLASVESPSAPIKPTKTLFPDVFSDTDDASPEIAKTESHFLWRRRRRMTDPGKLVKRQNSVMIHSSAVKTEESLASDSNVVTPPLPQFPPLQELKNHFLDLQIPDCHLHLQDLPHVAPTRPMEGSHSETQSKSVLGVATNLSDCREPQTQPPRTDLDDKEATATLFQSRLKWNTKHPNAHHQNVVPIRSSSVQTISVQARGPRTHFLDGSQTRDHMDQVHCPTSGHQKKYRQGPLQKAPRGKEDPDNHTKIYMKDHGEKYQGGFASTPTTTITGFDPNPQNLFEGAQSHMWLMKESRAVDSDETPTISSSQSSERVLCNVSTTETGWDTTTSSRRTTPQSDSQSFVLAPETPEIDTLLTDLVMPETSPTPPARRLYGAGAGLTSKAMQLKRSMGEPGGASIAMSRLQHRGPNQKQKIQAEEAQIPKAGLQHQRNGKPCSAHQRYEAGDHDGAMIQEAARIAIQRSRAKQIVTVRSHPPSRTPSPLIQDDPNFKYGCGGGGAKIGSRSARASTTHVQPSAQSGVRGRQHSNLEWVKGRISEKGPEDEKMGGSRYTGNKGNMIDRQKSIPGPVVTFVSFLVTIAMVAFGLGCAWWVMIQPVFDQSSRLWRRRHRGESTWQDIGVLVAAGLFCVVCALLVAGGIQAGLWLVLKL